jgi:hypothetical protein
MRQVTAKELQTLDPKRFDKAYYRWSEYAVGYDWWEFVEENFVSYMKAFGVAVTCIYFDSYPWHAKFDGRVDVKEWMQRLTLDEKYPALALAVEQDGSYVVVCHGRFGNTFDLYEHVANTSPLGVFKHLEESAWEELLEAQLAEANIETAIETQCQEACRKLAQDLESEYEYLTSVGAFIESCECNDVTFNVETEEEKEHEVHCEN